MITMYFLEELLSIIVFVIAGNLWNRLCQYWANAVEVYAQWL